MIEESVGEGRDRIKELATLEAAGIKLAGGRQKHIDARANAGIDQRWYEDIEAYEGRDELTRHYAGLRDVVQGYLSALDQKAQRRSTLVVNVTRRKVDTAAAVLQDIALPTDDRNWDLRHSTVPELVEQMGQKHIGLLKNGKPVMVNDDGQQRQATMADYAAMNMEEAKKRANAMRDEIDDQLDMSDGGCGYEGVVREVMHDERLLGVGIGKGPVVTSRVKKVWMPITDGTKTVHVLQRIQDLKPSSSRVNPWDVYPHPECGENPKKFPIWERIPGVTARDIRNYASIDGYIVENIKKVLMEGPRKPDHPADKPGPQQTVTEDTIYEAWEYHGDIDREVLEAAGCVCSLDDVWASYSGCVIMINNTVIKADIELLDTEEMPYDFFVTNKCSGSWAGYGKSFLSRMAQRAITAGWRAMMDNMGRFGGPQVVMNRMKCEPAIAGNWSVASPNIWLAKGDVDDVGKVFAIHEISSHQQEFAAIIKLGMEFLDDETAVPQIMEGEQGSATDVLGGMNLLIGSANVVQRRDLKCFDDQFTIPHIGRYVDWNMQYNPKPEIKGDFEVQARASGALMDSEIQSRNAANALGLLLNPALAAGMKKWDGVRKILKSWRYDPSDLVHDDATIKKNEDAQAQQQQGDPRVEVAKIRSDADQKIEAARAQSDQAIAKLRGDVDIAIKMIDKELTSAELTSVERQTLEKLKVQLALSAIDTRSANDHKLSDHIMDHYKHTTPAVLLPPTEPPGRAKPGKSFQQ